ncbi:branched-chain amino acid ABC transporter permease [Thermoflexus sp.]|uniref:branched-chain amino acid ABC transporter permease n=1 Tax=Thermoflexus sp. TaxID=1969742 RepID=UPI0029994998|nr:branched-chain amino acid ABC transporter permease [Thermoflexus sp.]MDW8065216.1 branched-chain amino acid ABC transporter permease [Anaerolineae bacterium]MDW8186278.1 branched-chain amino acid ABC transporter permease [Anaerolineae bacterium]
MSSGPQIMILGLALGGVYALMAIGLSLTYGVMRILNLAHAAFMILGAYLAYWALQIFHIDPLLSIPINGLIFFILGVILYRLLFVPLAGRPRYTEATLLLSFGLALGVEGLMGAWWTGIYRAANPAYATRSISFGSFYIPEGQLYATAMSVGMLLALWAFLQNTRIGRAIRATMQNRTAAQIVGVDVERISALAFGLGMASAGISGSILSFLFPFFPGKHWQWISTLLSLVVLGGMGSLIGTVVGAFLLSVASVYVSSILGPTWSPVTFYAALFLVMMIRPQGLFGKKEA